MQMEALHIDRERSIVFLETSEVDQVAVGRLVDVDIDDRGPCIIREVEWLAVKRWCA